MLQQFCNIHTFILSLKQMNFFMLKIKSLFFENNIYLSFELLNQFLEYFLKLTLVQLTIIS